MLVRAQSLLRRTINKLRAERRIAPRVRMLREGVDDLEPFTVHLIEEPDQAPASGAPAAPGFVAFLDEVQAEVFEYLQEQGHAA